MLQHYKFTPNMKMSELINNDHSLLLVLSRFGLHLGFGNKTVSEVCDESAIHCKTFLAVVNFLSAGNFDISSPHYGEREQPVAEWALFADGNYFRLEQIGVQK
jgi:regulator of cell morphogenesis and NO signaling